jgi:hypothetical protein
MHPKRGVFCILAFCYIETFTSEERGGNATLYFGAQDINVDFGVAIHLFEVWQSCCREKTAGLVKMLAYNFVKLEYYNIFMLGYTTIPLHLQQK